MFEALGYNGKLASPRIDTCSMNEPGENRYLRIESLTWPVRLIKTKIDLNW